MSKKMHKKTWTNIDVCCISHFQFADGTDLEFIDTIPRGWEQGKEGTFTDCTVCGRRWRLKPKKGAKPKSEKAEP